MLFTHFTDSPFHTISNTQLIFLHCNDFFIRNFKVIVLIQPEISNIPSIKTLFSDYFYWSFTHPFYGGYSNITFIIVCLCFVFKFIAIIYYLICLFKLYSSQLSPSCNTTAFGCSTRNTLLPLLIYIYYSLSMYRSL